MKEFQLAVRQFLFEELSKKYDCVIGSDYMDISYVDFSKAIQINHEDLRLRAGPVHVCVYIDLDNIAIYVYSPPLGKQASCFTGGQSRCFNNCLVDLPAPNFGNLLEIVDGFIQEAIQSAGQSSDVSFDPASRMLLANHADRPYIND